MFSEILRSSILIVAHPDDEALWFSSILEKTNEILICFLDVPSYPNLTFGRRKSLSEHPLQNIDCLGIEESEAFYDANWQNPVLTKYGIKVRNNSRSPKKYIDNYQKLKEKLEKRLVGYSNIFTFNPWGEYGHVEHVQVYRIVKELQGKLGFDLWFSNYCGNRSYNLMLRYISGFHCDYVTLKTDKALAKQIKDLYKRNGCWTWYSAWEWFNEESFMRHRVLEENSKTYGHIFPLNLIKCDLSNELKGESKIFNLLTRKLFGRHCDDRHGAPS